MVSFILGFYVQFYVRRRYPEWFLEYNHILAAAISGGTELLVFVTAFAVQGASGVAVPFPPYWGNNFQKGNFDFCSRNPALGWGSNKREESLSAEDFWIGDAALCCTSTNMEFHHRFDLT